MKALRRNIRLFICEIVSDVLIIDSEHPPASQYHKLLPGCSKNNSTRCVLSPSQKATTSFCLTVKYSEGGDILAGKGAKIARCSQLIIAPWYQLVCSILLGTVHGKY